MFGQHGVNLAKKIIHTLKLQKNILVLKKKIEIIAISIDKDSKKWSEFILKNNRKGNQLHTTPSSDFVKFYEIGALPRYILLDKKGYIISSDEIRPSNPELIKMLEEIIAN